MTLLPEVKQELVAAAARRVGTDPKSRGTRGFSLARASRMLRAGARPIPVLASLALTLLVAVLVLSLGHAGGGGTHTSGGGHGASPTALTRRAEGYIARAQRATLASDRACVVRFNVGPTFLRGAPPRALLSVLGVLRRRAPAPSNRLLNRIGISVGSEVHVNYIRLARRTFGERFYIIPEGNSSGRSTIPTRCFSETMTAVRRELRGAPAALRTRTLTLASAEIASDQSQDRNQASLCFAVLAHGRSLGTGCSPVSGLFQYTGGLDNGQPLRGGGTILSGVVPDGVASIVVHYSARHGDPARTLTASVINNVAVLKVPARTADQPFPTKIIWRSASGRVIRTFG
jgi:hypothetical protein